MRNLGKLQLKFLFVGIAQNSSVIFKEFSLDKIVLESLFNKVAGLQRATLLYIKEIPA